MILIRVFPKLPLLLAVMTAWPLASAGAADGHARGKKVSMHEVAEQIRRTETWQILEARPRHRKSGYRFFQFKVINQRGQVKVIDVDPHNPSLRRLQQ